MPYQLNWYDAEQTVLHLTAEGNVTWEQFHAIYGEVLTTVRTTPYRVDVVINSAKQMPPGNPLPHYSELMSNWTGAEQPGLFVMVRNDQMNSFIQGMVSIASKITRVEIGERLRFVGSIEEGLEKIYADRGERLHA